jgi:hypothetical protein
VGEAKRMSHIVPILLAAAVGLVLALWWASRHTDVRFQQERRSRWLGARSRGWFYQEDLPHPGDFKIRGEWDGIEWEFVCLGETTGATGLCTGARAWWSTAAVRAEAPVLCIAGRRLYRQRLSPSCTAFWRMLGRLRSREENPAQQARRDFLARHAELASGSPRFRRRFAVVSPAFGSSSFDETLERLFLEWPAGEGHFLPERHLEVWMDGAGLRLEVSVPVASLPVIEHMVRLGAALAQSLQPDRKRVDKRRSA